MDVYVSRFTAWAPGFTGAENWKSWARGEREIPKTQESPSLEYADPLFRRRLSQISRMTIQVIHDIQPIGENTKIVFVSLRGEVSQQLKINRMLIEDEDLKPAAFSLSVFNTPPALATIALQLTSGYSAVYPSGDRFDSGFLAAAAGVLSGAAGEALLVYADELCPADYGKLGACRFSDLQGSYEPFAFAALLTGDGRGIPAFVNGNPPETPGLFLKNLYGSRELYV
ncbi:MAG: beta-ketoacyl synthase chain length factor [Treponema sp.]|jgi:hypothetical protein|nr:beta-ketoacyl synthase chain length factor [Treponema sp.]